MRGAALRGFGAAARPAAVLRGRGAAPGLPDVSAGSAAPPMMAVSARTAGALQQLMEAVVTKGTGTNAAIPGAVVGGKTGTAQHGVDNTGTPYAWFISYAKPPGGSRFSGQ